MGKKLNFRTIARTVCSEERIDFYIEMIEKCNIRYEQFTIKGTSNCMGPRLIVVQITKGNKKKILNLLFNSGVITIEEKDKLEKKKIKTMEVQEIQ